MTFILLAFKRRRQGSTLKTDVYWLLFVVLFDTVRLSLLSDGFATLIPDRAGVGRGVPLGMDWRG